MAPPWASKSRPIQSNYPAFQQQGNPDFQQTMNSTNPPDVVFDPRGPTTNIQRKLSIPSEVVVQAGVRSVPPSAGQQYQQPYQQVPFAAGNYPNQQFQNQQFTPVYEENQQYYQPQGFQQHPNFGSNQNYQQQQAYPQEFLLNGNQNFNQQQMQRPTPAVPAKGAQQSTVAKQNQPGQFANGSEPFRPPQTQGQRPNQPAGGKQLFKQAPDNRGNQVANNQTNFQQPSENFQFLKIAGATPYQQAQPQPQQRHRRWTIDKLRATDAIIPLQSGTNQYSSQRGMTGFGTPRDVNGKHVHRLWEEEYPEYVTDYYSQN